MNERILKRFSVVCGVAITAFFMTVSLAHADGVSVTGLVKFEGKPPARRPIDTRTDKYCKDMYAKNPLLTDSAEINENGEFAHIFVWIDNPPEKDYPVPSEPVLLDQFGCRYTVPVFGMRVGQTLLVKNSDETTHNVRGFVRHGRVFNFGQPPGLKPRTRVFEVAELPLKIKCDVHGWMLSFCFVMDHPFFGVSGMDGRFEIENVPPGTYTLKAWHEKLGELEQEITVGDSNTAAADIVYRRPVSK